MGKMEGSGGGGGEEREETARKRGWLHHGAERGPRNPTEHKQMERRSCLWTAFGSLSQPTYNLANMVHAGQWLSLPGKCLGFCLQNLDSTMNSKPQCLPSLDIWKGRKHSRSMGLHVSPATITPGKASCIAMALDSAKSCSNGRDASLRWSEYE